LADPDFPILDEFQRIDFPGAGEANEDGIIASGGNLSPGMLLSAYSQGAFPWYGEDDPILWWNPDPRCVLFPEKLHVSSRMERKLRNGNFILRSDTDFREVIGSCAGIKRAHEEGTWINDDIIQSYCRMHELGWAHSIEAYIPSESGLILAGGLYGISLGHCFFGESMFSRYTDASKAAFISMVRALSSRGIKLIDCQISTPHLLSLGAEVITRKEYMKMLDSLLRFPDLRGNWNLFSGE
jgi:leucyl/phenylalanyl-tRNA--protein transferase